jgi:drug/metabolite transporter (DMT)-like permease
LIYLALSVLTATLLLVVFKLFERFRINILHAIVVNYLVASSFGFMTFEGKVEPVNLPHYSWFYYTVLLGLFFIGVFNLMGITAQRSGLSVVSVASKMSLTIPILFGLLYYKESLGVFKLVGILLALAAVYLASIKAKEGLIIRRRNIIFPLLVFLGSGLIDLSIKFIEDSFVSDDQVPLFLAVVFGAAAFIGILLLVIQGVRGRFKFELRNIVGGVILGIVNYGSLYYLVKALKSDTLESSEIFMVNNVAVVMLSTLAGIVLFKEKLLPKNWLGVFLAVLSILVVTLSTL